MPAGRLVGWKTLRGMSQLDVFRLLMQRSALCCDCVVVVWSGAPADTLRRTTPTGRHAAAARHVLISAISSSSSSSSRPAAAAATTIDWQLRSGYCKRLNYWRNRVSVSVDVCPECERNVHAP